MDDVPAATHDGATLPPDETTRPGTVNAIVAKIQQPFNAADAITASPGTPPDARTVGDRIPTTNAASSSNAPPGLVTQG